MVNLGKLAYDAYLQSSGGVSLVSGAKLPAWEELKPEIKTAWEAAAEAIRAHYFGDQLDAAIDAARKDA